MEHTTAAGPAAQGLQATDSLVVLIGTHTISNVANTAVVTLTS